jgi:Multicopper oxidase
MTKRLPPEVGHRAWFCGSRPTSAALGCLHLTTKADAQADTELETSSKPLRRLRSARCPFHVHGAGRFLVLARDGVEEPDLVWKDTVLVRTSETVDILLHVTNPGRWMAHCHIAEHHESGMMFGFDVEP